MDDKVLEIPFVVKSCVTGEYGEPEEGSPVSNVLPEMLIGCEIVLGATARVSQYLYELGSTKRNTPAHPGLNSDPPSLKVLQCIHHP